MALCRRQQTFFFKEDGLLPQMPLGSGELACRPECWCICAGLEDLVASNFEDEDHLEEDIDARHDPIATMDILEFVAEQLKALSSAHPDQFHACCSQLGPERLRPLIHLFPS